MSAKADARKLPLLVSVTNPNPTGPKGPIERSKLSSAEGDEDMSYYGLVDGFVGFEPRGQRFVLLRQKSGGASKKSWKPSFAASKCKPSASEEKPDTKRQKPEKKKRGPFDSTWLCAVSCTVW